MLRAMLSKLPSEQACIGVECADRTRRAVQDVQGLAKEQPLGPGNGPLAETACCVRFTPQRIGSASAAGVAEGAIFVRSDSGSQQP